LNKVFKRQEDDLKVYSVSCDTGLNVKNFLADLNQFLQEEKDKNLLTIVQGSTENIVTEYLKKYENQLSIKQSSILEIEEKIARFSRQKKNLEITWDAVVEVAYKKLIEEGKHELDLLTPYNSQREQLVEKIDRCLKNDNTDKGLEKAKNYITVHIKNIAKPCIELALDGIDKNLVEIDQTVKDLLVDQIEMLDRAYNINSVMQTIPSDALYEKTFDAFLNAEVSSFSISLLKTLSNLQIGISKSIDVLSVNVTEILKSFSKKSGEVLNEYFFKDMIKNNPNFFGVSVEDVKKKRLLDRKAREESDNYASQHSNGLFFDNKLRKGMVKKLMAATDNGFIGKPNITGKSHDKPIISIVKREFRARLIKYVEKIKVKKYKEFEKVLENIQQSLEQQKNDLNKSNSEKEILLKNRSHIKNELEFLKKESEEVMKHINSIY